MGDLKMKGERIKERKRRERLTEFQVALQLFLQDYDDIDHYDRSGVLWQFAKTEIYSYAFDDGVRHAENAVPDDHSAPDRSNRP
jgi:hypothetical protein